MGIPSSYYNKPCNPGCYYYVKYYTSDNCKNCRKQLNSLGCSGPSSCVYNFECKWRDWSSKLCKCP